MFRHLKAFGRNSNRLGLPFILLLAGCAAGASGIAFQRQAVPVGQGMIYLYKAPGQIGAAQGLPMLLDGKDVGLLRNGGYLAVVANPGDHVLGVGPLNDMGNKFYTVNDPLALEVRVGGDQFVSVRAFKGAPTRIGYVDEVIYGSTHVVFEKVAESVALTEIQSRRLSQQ